MTSVVTVSSVTAAYAVEPVKPASRVTGSNFMEESLEAFTRKASQTDDPRQKVILNVVRPPALALFFLTSEGIPTTPASSSHMAENAYRATMAMAPEPADQPAQTTPTAPQQAASAQADAAPQAVVPAPDFAPQSTT